MARKRSRSASDNSGDPGSPIRDAADRGSLVVFSLVAIVWFVVLMGQRISGDTARWMYFLVPGETVDSWIDGPVSWQGLRDRAVVAAAALLTVASAWGSGRLMTRRGEVFRSLTGLERAALDIALGLSVQATVVLGSGVLGSLRQTWSLPVLVLCTWTIGAGVGWVMGAFCAGQRSRRPRSEENTGRGPLLQNAVPCLFTLLLAALLLCRAGQPPAEYDVQEYHLQAPKQWWQSGEIGFMPHNIYANMPMAAESQAVVTMMWWQWFGAGADAWWWGAFSGKLVVASYAILTAVLVGGFVRVTTQDRQPTAHFSHIAGAWTPALVLAFPALIEGASVGLIEAALAAYLAAGMLIAAVHRRQAIVRGGPDSGGHRVSLACWLGWVAGAAVACKYPAVVLVIPALLILGGWAVTWRSDSGGTSDWRSVLVRPGLWLCFLAAMFVAGGAWYVKNALLAGNPVYPLLGSWLGGETLTSEKVAQWNAAHAAPAYSLSALGNSVAGLLWGWRLQGWCVVPLVAAAAWLWSKRSDVRILLVATAVAIGLWWLVTHRIERFTVPVLPLAFGLAGIGVAELYRTTGRGRVTLVLSILVLINAFYVASPVLGDPRLFVDLRYLRIDDRSQSSLTRLPEHLVWVNRNLSPSDRLLLVGDAAVFDYEIPVAYATTFDRSPLRDIIEAPPQQWAERLRDAGFTHILVHWGEIDRLRFTYGFDSTITPEAIERMKRVGAVRAASADVGARVELLEVRGGPADR